MAETPHRGTPPRKTNLAARALRLAIPEEARAIKERSPGRKQAGV